LKKVRAILHNPVNIAAMATKPKKSASKKKSAKPAKKKTGKR